MSHTRQHTEPLHAISTSNGIQNLRVIRTTSFIDTGAFSESATSCAVSEILILRVRTVLIASLKLFCLPCLVPLPSAPFAKALHRCILELFRPGHRSLEWSPLGRPCSSGFGVRSRGISDMSSSASSWNSSGWKSCEKRGNLKLPLGLADEERRRSGPVACGAIDGEWWRGCG